MVLLARQHRDKMLTKVPCPALPPIDTMLQGHKCAGLKLCLNYFGLNALAWWAASQAAASLPASPSYTAQMLKPALQVVEQLLLCCIAADR